uniref:RAB39B, member RAS oncogene family n=1 Tax=Oryzias sinensis TaxID=183150 RepID=A0A8C7X9R1_9TELE
MNCSFSTGFREKGSHLGDIPQIVKSNFSCLIHMLVKILIFLLPFIYVTLGRLPLYFVYRSITRAYYRNSVGGLLLFDITNRRSFQNVHDWLEEARSHVQPHSIVFMLVGHKCDLEAQRQVTQQEAEKLSGAYGMRYIETSARDAINVEHAFTELTRDIFALVRSGDITIQEGWEGVKSGFVPNVVHSSEEVTKSDRRCLC